ncbi:hypothetical protein [Bergeyella sp. RCAD1439]|uniref:hypothetical protein n=1 Tax=Bergeyella anatis TaxID=3113737 RepID=UPI002E174B69|nr:hypothetical protein [Bergeyella sp. RCAD1439]
MIVKFIVFSLICSFLILRISYFRKKTIKLKVLIFSLFLIIFFITGIFFLILLWNSSDDFSYKYKYINSTSFRILDTYNQPINNINIKSMKKNSIVQFEIDSSGLAVFYNINNERIIISAKGYKNDTILLKNYSLDTIHLKPN